VWVLVRATMGMGPHAHTTAHMITAVRNACRGELPVGMQGWTCTSPMQQANMLFVSFLLPLI